MANPLTLFNRNRRSPARDDAGVSDPFFQLQDDMNRLFDETFATFASPAAFSQGFGRAFTPRADLRETDDALELDVELPGVAEEDIDVQLTDNVLTISGEKRSEKKDERKGYRYTERSFGSFSRSIPLAYDIDPDAVEAVFRNGVLTLRLPKPPGTETKSRRIPISRG